MPILSDRGYTGGLLESEMFGRIIEKEEDAGQREYIPYRGAMDIVKKSQPDEDLSCPKARFANDLYQGLYHDLELENKKDLRFYTAVGSCLDYKHGVDAFFEMDFEGKIITVTLDITSSKNKSDGYKADVIIEIPGEGLDPDLEEDKEAYKFKVEESVNNITKIIDYKISEILRREK